MIAYALTIFLSAFLLFQVQPLISRRILPWFGGSPAVWTTCMLFFQLALLAGYIYAHLLSTHLRPRRQMIVHALILCAALFFLPIYPGPIWKPDSPDHPAWRILLLLAAVVGLPYFALSSTSPLIQKWFSMSNAGKSPYRLYALSNAGSLLALAGGPFVVEPLLAGRAQSLMWSLGFVAFAALCVWCARGLWNAPAESAVAPAQQSNADAVSAPRPGALRRVLWLLLAANGVAMLLSVTNQMCQDVAVVPFLWVLPLGIYLLTFIICFDNERWYFRPVIWPALVITLVAACWLMGKGVDMQLRVQIIIYSALLFLCCMVTHGELVRLKPAPRYLTSFYLTTAAGGALGGVLVSIVAPLIFRTYMELQISIWLCCAVAALALLLATGLVRRGASLRQRVALIATAAIWLLAIGVALGYYAWDSLRAALHRLVISVGAPLTFPTNMELHIGIWLCCSVVVIVLLLGTGVVRSGVGLRQRAALTAIALLGLGIALGYRAWDNLHGYVSISRNFYGVLRVREDNIDKPLHKYTLVHGVISHGWQYQDEYRRRMPVSYYGDESGVGLAVRYLPRASGMRVGVVGLGTATMAAHGLPGDHYRFYEINPAVLDLARTRFTYLADSPAECEVVLGDARLSLERELEQSHPQNFDVLVLDAFSSDSIPVHLLTIEAFQMYLKHMGEGGVIAVHISNRFLDLRPVVWAAVEKCGLKAVEVSSEADPLETLSRANWILVTRDEAFLRGLEERPESSQVDDLLKKASPLFATIDDKPPARTILWTDDYCPLFGIVRWQ